MASLELVRERPTTNLFTQSNQKIVDANQALIEANRALTVAKNNLGDIELVKNGGTMSELTEQQKYYKSRTLDNLNKMDLYWNTRLQEVEKRLQIIGISQIRLINTK